MKLQKYKNAVKIYREGRQVLIAKVDKGYLIQFKVLNKVVLNDDDAKILTTKILLSQTGFENLIIAINEFKKLKI